MAEVSETPQFTLDDVVVRIDAIGQRLSSLALNVATCDAHLQRNSEKLDELSEQVDRILTSVGELSDGVHDVENSIEVVSAVCAETSQSLTDHVTACEKAFADSKQWTSYEAGSTRDVVRHNVSQVVPRLLSATVGDTDTTSLYRLGCDLITASAGRIQISDAKDGVVNVSTAVNVGTRVTVSAINTKQVSMPVLPTEGCLLAKGIEFTGSGNKYENGVVTQKKGGVMVVNTTPNSTLEVQCSIPKHALTEDGKAFQVGFVVNFIGDASSKVEMFSMDATSEKAATLRYVIPTGCSSVEFLFVREQAGGSISVLSIDEKKATDFSTAFASVISWPDALDALAQRVSTIEEVARRTRSDCGDLISSFSNLRGSISEEASNAVRSYTKAYMWGNALEAVVEEIRDMFDSVDDLHKDFSQLRLLTSKYLDWKLQNSAAELSEHNAKAAYYEAEANLTKLKGASYAGSAAAGAADLIQAVDTVAGSVHQRKREKAAESSW